MKHFNVSAKLPRKICAAFILAFLFFYAGRAYSIPTPWLHVEGKWIKDPNGNNVVLRGVSLAGLAQTRSKTVKQRIDMATNTANGWYSRVVRLPVEPGNWNAGPDNYFKNILDPAVQYCISKGVYVIIDWHYVADYQQHTTSTNNFWNYIAPKYKNNPQVLYEVFNEPIDPGDWATFKNWVQPIVNNIRSKAPNNLVLVASPRWATKLSGAISNPVTGKNIVYVSHNYPKNPATGTDSWDAAFGNAADKYPVIVTEWGYEYPGYKNAPSEGTTSGFGVPFKAYIETKPNVGWTAWAFDNAWGPEMFDANWNLRSGENYMGQFAKDWLYQKRNSNLPSSSSTARYETENATLSGVVIKTAYSGYSGTGYGDYQNASYDYIEWTVNAPSAGTYNVIVRYSNGGTDRPLKVTVNGTVTNSGRSFPNTGGWGTWGTVTLTPPLVAGSNKIRLTATGSSGPDIDYIERAASPNTTASTSLTQSLTLEPEEKASTLKIFPNPASDMVTIEAAMDLSNSKVTLTDMSGRKRACPYQANGNTITVQTAMVEAGNYVLSVQTGNTIITKQLVVKPW